LHAAAEAVLRDGQHAGTVSAALDVPAAARLLIGGGHTVALMQFAGASADQIETFIVQLIDALIHYAPRH